MNEMRDFKTQLEQLKAAYPDLEQLPDEVAQAAAQGRDMVQAYGHWLAQEKEGGKSVQQIQAENAVLKAENESLKREIAILKQNAGAQQRAVGGVQGGGLDKPDKTGFLAGLESGGW